MITEKEVRMVLTSLGYRLPDGSTDRMIKPFGLSIYIFLFKELRLTSHFYGANGEFLCWSSQDFDKDYETEDSEKFSRSVSMAEECMTHHHFIDQPNFGFLTRKEETEFRFEGIL